MATVATSQIWPIAIVNLGCMATMSECSSVRWYRSVAMMLPHLILELEYDLQLRNRFTSVHQHGDLVMHRVVLQQLVALVPEILLNVVAQDALDLRRLYHFENVRA
jgi:hypothetical protein